MNKGLFIYKTVAYIRRKVLEGYIPIIVTNQGGVELGHLDKDLLQCKFDKILEELRSFINNNIHLYVDYSYNKPSYSRKPNPGFAYKAAIDYELDLRSSIMIGDASGRVKWDSEIIESSEDIKVFFYNYKIYDERHVYRVLKDNKLGVGDIFYYTLEGINGSITYKATVTKIDFSDSDYKFSLNAGIKTYIDVDKLV